MTSASLFGAGVVFTAACAAVSFVNFTHNAKYFMGKAYDDDLWLKHWHFRTHKPSTEQLSKQNQKVIEMSGAGTQNTHAIAVGLAVLSAAFAASGGIALLWSLAVSMSAR